MLRYLSSLAVTMVVAFSVFSFHPASIFADDIPSDSDVSENHGAENIGSITLCKIIADQNGNISDGASNAGNFYFPEVEAPLPPYVPHAAGTIPTTHFLTPLSLNADLIGHDGVNDAQCITYSDLHLGSYFYAQEKIQGSGWAEPLYNDQYTVTVGTLSDFFPYSRHFSLDEHEDVEHWNKNSDGHVVLSANRPDRTIIVLNRILKDTPPLPIFECSDGKDNDGDGKIDSLDPTCHTDGNPSNPETYAPSQNTENSAPVITLLGAATTTITVGDTFTDPGATAFDQEDGDITSSIVVTGTVATSTAGTYTLHYNVQDSEGLSAEPKTLKVDVEEAPMCRLPEFTSPMSLHTTLGTSFSYTLTATSTGTTTSIFNIATSSLPLGLSFSVDTISGTTTVPGTFNVAVSAVNMCGTSTSTLSIIVDPNGGGGGGSNPECSDGKDNDGDGKIDSLDPTCHTDGNPSNPETYAPSQNTENSAPVITLLGAATTTITVGDTFTDPGATAFDQEDGDITSSIVVTGTVATSTAGTYTLHYNVKDSKGLSAEEKTRTVTVNEKPMMPPTGGGGGGGGCSSNCGGGGGGGGVVLLPPASSFGGNTSTTSIAPSECYYLREFIKFGANNNPEEVKKLQVFLNSFEGTNLIVNGFYDVSTLSAVNAFQVKYKVDILDPWGHEAPTGFVYLTTRKKVNEIYCHAAFPLDQNQLEEVTAFKKLLESLKIHGIVSFSTGAGENSGRNKNETGIVLGTTYPAIGETGNATVATGSAVAVTGRSVLRNMVAAAYGAVSKAVTSYWLVLIFAALVVITGVLLKKLFKEEEI